MEEKIIVTKLDQLVSAQKSFISDTAGRLNSMQVQMDAMDMRGKAAAFPHQFTGKSFMDSLKENDSVARLMHDRKGRAVLNLEGDAARHILERKTTITTGGSGTIGSSSTGVLQIDRLPGITPEARQQLTIRDALTARPTTFQVIDFVKVNSPLSAAQPVAEAALKPENAVTFSSTSERVKTIATVLPASRQAIEDVNELAGFLQSSLGFYVDLAEELELLSGDGSGEHLHGLIPQAVAFNTSLLPAARGWNKIDMIGRSIQQITASKEMPPTFVAMNPNDWWDIRLIKDGFGRYVLGDPQSGAFAAMQFGSLMPVQALFDLKVIATNNIAAGTFLLGSGSPIASEIRDRMELVVEISTEHSDFFQRNLVLFRAEKRLALVVRRPLSYLTGTFTTSPAGM